MLAVPVDGEAAHCRTDARGAQVGRWPRIARQSSARARSAAFTVHADSVATAIRINLAGRELDGRVPGEQFARYAQHLTENFLALVVWNQSISLDAATSAAVGTLHAAPHLDRSGNHDFGEWFVAAGPDVPRGTLQGEIEVVDFAPSVAQLLGVPLTGMSGTTIEQLSGCAVRGR